MAEGKSTPPEARAEAASDPLIFSQSVSDQLPNRGAIFQQRDVVVSAQGRFSQVSLASDNNSGIHPDVLKAMREANTGYTIGYGDDAWTARALKLFKDEFGDDTEVFFVFNGTGANVLAIQTLLHPFNAVICPQSAHIHNDEAGSPEAVAGTKLLPVDTADGKLRPEHIDRFMKLKGFVHAVQPGMISVSQVTEQGTIYSPDELRALTAKAHANELLVHMDGARIANAAVAQGLGFREATRDLGIDVLSFGATKNGLMMGEAVLFFGHEKAHIAANFRKQNAQLFSKMRFISAQFIPYLENNLWKDNALHANQMAQKLGDLIRDIPQVRIVREIEANSLFVEIPPAVSQALSRDFFFYVWNADRNEIRLMTSFMTTDHEIQRFADALASLCHK